MLIFKIYSIVFKFLKLKFTQISFQRKTAEQILYVKINKKQNHTQKLLSCKNIR